MWVKRWKDEIDPEPVLPGVWKRKDGGFHVRGRALDPRTKKLREVNKVLADVTKAREAAKLLEAELDAIRAGNPEDHGNLPAFAVYATELLEKKVTDGSIASQATRAKWSWAINWVLDAVGDITIDKLRAADWEAWKKKVAPLVKSGKKTPTTVNTCLTICRVVTAKAAREFEIRDSLAAVDSFDTRGHRTYTHDSPNSLPVELVPKFLEHARVLFPEYFAMIYVMLMTGLRPSTLRPLRWKGEDPDVRLDEAELLLRKSQTMGDEVMPFTKTAKDQVIHMPPDMVAILRWHLERLKTENEHRAVRFPHLAQAMAKSELLFPARPNRWNHGGGFLSANVLDDVFVRLGEELKLKYEITPRSMRRTYQDLSRAAGNPDILTRAVSGHTTEAMQRRYSTVGAEEMRGGLARVIAVATKKPTAATSKKGRKAA